MPKKKKLSVRIRMYRHGLGDCFLLTFQRPNKPDFNMLIDCGILQFTKGEEGIMREVAESIKANVAKLDVVAVTHEHADHISGFGWAKDIFDQITFDKVWLGWTDDEKHPKYEAMRARFRKQITGLKAALKIMESPDLKGLNQIKSLQPTVNALVNEFFADDILGAKNMSRSQIWEYIVKERGKDRCEFCIPGKVLTFDGLEGVKFYILGPPENFELFDDKEPPANQKDSETYRREHRFALADSIFAAAESSGMLNFDSHQPFDKDFRISIKDETEEGEVKNNPLFAKYYQPENSWKKIDESWLGVISELALHLDNFTNNTCLAFAIELVESGKVLLFPGDAQFGNLSSWKDIVWKEKDKDGNPVTTENLMERTVFYKVGHHGSHNATLKSSGLEIMNNPDLVSEFVAMIPVDTEKAKTKKWEMPEEELFIRLKEKTKGRVILADDIGQGNSAEKMKKPFLDRCQHFGLSDSETTKFLGKIKFGGSFTRKSNDESKVEPLFVEYTIES